MLLNLIKLVDPQLKISFNRYSQSHKCQTVHDASVSYGSAVVWSPNKQPALPATMTPTRASTAAASSFSRASTAAFSGGFGDDGNGGGSFKKLATSGYFAGDSCTFDFGAITGESDGGASSDPFGSGATKTLFGSGALSPAHAATPRHTHAPNTPRVAAFARRFDERAQARADRSERESDWAQLGDALNEAELAVANRQSTRGEEGLSPRVLLEMKFTVPARSNEPPLFAADPRPPVGALASSVAPVAPVPLKETPTRSNGSAKLQAPGTHAYVRREPPQHRVATTAAASDGSVSIAYRSLARSTWLRILEFLPLQFALHTFACLASDFARAVDLDLQLEREGLCLWRCSRPDAMDAGTDVGDDHCYQAILQY